MDGFDAGVFRVTSKRCLLDLLLSFCHRSLLTSAIMQSFWPRELTLTNIDFLFRQFAVNP